MFWSAPTKLLLFYSPINAENLPFSRLFTTFSTTQDQAKNV
jgi:hypothetical protein